MQSKITASNMKKGIFSLGLGLVISSLAVLFTNASSKPACSTQATSVRSKAILLAIKKAQKQKNGLTDAEVVSHSANRVGFGLAPYVGIYRPDKASACTTTRAAVRIANDIMLMQNKRERKSASVYKTLQRYFAPMTYATQKSLARINKERQDIRKLAQKKNDTDAIRGTNQIFAFSRVQERNKGLLRAVFGSQLISSKTGKMYDRQVNLVDQMNEFWFNHFNINLSKVRLAAIGLNGYEETLRNNMGGTFASLLYASVTHPAMLRYLDNHRNKFICTKKVKKHCVKGEASNQNLGRELIELHSLGIGPKSKQVPGSPYTQKDVEEVAKILTGWNTDAVSEVTTVFHAKFHLPEASIKAGKLKAPQFINHKFTNTSGKNRLKELTQILAQHPLTKKNICLKLVDKFYTAKFTNAKSSPYKSCINAWGKYGNLPEIYLALMTNDNFWTVENYNNKVKNPLEQVASTIRSYGVNGKQLISYIQNNEKFNFSKWRNPNLAANSFKQQINYYENHKAKGSFKFLNQSMGLLLTLGLPYRSFIPPTGYPDDGSKWVSTGYMNQIARTPFKMTQAISYIFNNTHNKYLFNENKEGAAEKLLAANKYEDFYKIIHANEMILGDLMMGNKPGAFVLSDANVKRVQNVMNNKSNWTKIDNKILAPRQTLKEVTLNTAEFMFK